MIVYLRLIINITLYYFRRLLDVLAIKKAYPHNFWVYAIGWSYDDHLFHIQFCVSQLTTTPLRSM